MPGQCTNANEAGRAQTPKMEWPQDLVP